MKNSTRTGLICALLVSSASVASAEVDCTNAAVSTKSVMDFPAEGYWFQASGDCRITYTSVGGTNSQLYNYCTKKSEPITTNYDAFPVPGFAEDLYVHPNGGQSFYKFADARASEGSNQPIYQDGEHTGVYESIGLLSTANANKKTVRIAAGWSNGAFRDYEIKKNGDNFSITPQGPVQQVCKNLASGGLDSQLPIISRNGQYIAARELNSQESKIFKINMPGGTCTEVGVIPQRTSKVSFGFDNKTALYVIQDPNTNKGRLMAYDMTTKKERTVTSPTEDVQYMSSKPDGTIMYTRRKQDGGTELVFVNSASVEEGSNQKAEEALGLLWASKCNVDVDAGYAGAVGRRLKSSNCSQLATPQEVSSALADSPYSSVTAQSISALCSSASRGSAAGSARER